MLIKSIDDKSPRLKLLTELRQSALLDTFQENWLKSELQRQQRGWQGERDAAFYIDSWKRDSDTHAVLHDLRLLADGETAQIDHLVISRTQRFYLFETKCFNGQMHINEQGEFSVEYPGERVFGVPSPLEQSRRHERILSKVLDRLGINARAGGAFSFHHIVLVHPKAVIHRPDAKRFDTRNVIKADMIARWHDEYVEGLNAVQVFGNLLKLHSEGSLKAWAEKLAREHLPENPLELPEFMKPKVTAPTFNQPKAAGNASPSVSAPPVTRAAAIEITDATGHPLYRKLVCANCQAKLSYAEGRFCWNQAARYGGLQYCRQHQSSF
ncbi:nuclease-related domain-containing protein [Roseateles sp.]|uniref:nuclease-related domain-containing protein n=1 Tax=Roseateles sp. TaxID=1971397 RepID=UPI003D123C04